ncbi:MAG: polysulfide reductase NrfD [Proteobacteria bacterium]|nr:polysulfide reductase NrfD [Pseudomonadota bacterium]MBU1687377.1 polysulfide reductase NrfD [Pseudomonadota bacterium]
MASNFSIAATASSIAAAAEPRVGSPAINKVTMVFLLMLLSGLGVGLYAFYAGHHVAYNNTREMPWGILISSYAFFAITSTGLCLLAALSHIFGGNRLAPLANRMVFLSIVSILSAFFMIGLELENPWRLAIYNIISPNFTSNIWWMGTLYGMAVGMMLVEFFLILTGRFKLAVALGVGGALAEVMANTNLGAVFSTLSAHPFWYGSQLPVYFLASAFMTGAAAIILFTHFAHVIRRQPVEGEVFQGLQAAGKVMAGVLFLIAVATVWKFISYYTGGSELGRLAAGSLIDGPLSTNFWVFEVAIGMVMPLIILVLSGFRSIQAMSSAALMALVGGFFQRYDLVVAGQQVPHFYGWDNLPLYQAYIPSASEFMVLLGAFGLMGAGFLLGERFFGKAFRHSAGH